MENYSANISASHSEVVSKEGMEVKCTTTLSPFQEGNWYGVYEKGGELVIKANYYSESYWPVGLKPNSTIPFDLTSPRWPEKNGGKVKDGWYGAALLPKENGFYLVHKKGYDQPLAVCYYVSSTGKWLSPAAITHWQPLPSPPNTTA